MLALRVARSFTGTDVATVLNQLSRERGGTPACLRTDNGSEFTGAELSRWRERRDVEPLLSRRGKPIDNAICESTNGRIRAEFLNTTVSKGVHKTGSTPVRLFARSDDRAVPDAAARGNRWIACR